MECSPKKPTKPLTGSPTILKRRLKDSLPPFLLRLSKRIKEESDPDRKYKLKVLRNEFGSLHDAL